MVRGEGEPCDVQGIIIEYPTPPKPFHLTAHL